ISCRKQPSEDGMLKRTKYSRLRNDSPTSLEENPRRMLPLKRDLCLDSDFAQLGPGMPTQHGPSTLRDFIPRMANIRLQSPISWQGVKEQTNMTRGRSISALTDKTLSRTEWGSGSSERFCSHPSLNAPMSTVVGTGSTMVHHHIKVPLPTHVHDNSKQDLHSFYGRLQLYMGSVEVTQSMRTLDFDTRMQVTREAISRLCMRTSVKTAPVCKALSSVLGQTNLQFSGSRIILTVSTESMTLIAASSLQKIAHHPMQTISFASGGDSDMADHIAYVAKDLANERACHILECPEGQATEVINSIGWAFETRFRQLLSQTPSLLSTSSRLNLLVWEVSEHCDYYNVTPGDPGGIEDLQVTGKESKDDADMHRVRLNCSNKTQTTYSHWRSLGREQAESLLTCSGDFLVRESSSAAGQYVLSGMEGATVRHLLLVDPHGQVRTRDQVFLSVGHLVRFHMENQMPIVSGTSELCLKQPILQTHKHSQTYAVDCLGLWPPS
uniref:SHC adaptor protein 4 n=1 Tax=Amphilophus citrinellus TaxID=61819 RepID=A0A3Q0STA9_AMPCI